MFCYTKLCIWVVLTLLLLSACGNASPVQSGPTRLNLVVAQEPSTLDIQRTSEGAVTEVLSLVCETLFYPALGGAQAQPQPWLAESWAIATTGMTMAVTLRAGITFHDGTPLTADAVKKSFERLQDPRSSASPVYEDLQDVNVRAIDERVVMFEFSKPRVDFVSVLTKPYAAIVSASAARQDEQQFTRKPICTGPYIIQDWQPAQRVLLLRNEKYYWAPRHYKNQGPPSIDTVAIRFISEADIRFQALINNELDVLSLSTPEQVSQVRSKPGQFQIFESLISGISFVGFNCRRAPTNELQVRQALAHAIDRDGIVKAVLAGLAEPAIAPLSPDIFGYSPELAKAGYAFDLQKSRQLLAQAGFVDSDGDGVLDRNGEALSLVMLTTTSNTYEKISTLIQSQLKEVGVQLSVKPVPAAEIPDITPTGEFDLLLYNYSWGTPDALQLFLGTERIGTSNRVAYSNPQVDKLLEQAERYPENSTEKQTLLIEAQRQILQDAPWQPLLTRKVVIAVNKRVQGVRASQSGGLLWHDAFITQP